MQLVYEPQQLVFARNPIDTIDSQPENMIDGVAHTIELLLIPFNMGKTGCLVVRQFRLNQSEARCRYNYLELIGLKETLNGSVQVDVLFVVLDDTSVGAFEFSIFLLVAAFKY